MSSKLIIILSIFVAVIFIVCIVLTINYRTESASLTTLGALTTQAPTPEALTTTSAAVAQMTVYGLCWRPFNYAKQSFTSIRKALPAGAQMVIVHNPSAEETHTFLPWFQELIATRQAQAVVLMQENCLGNAQLFAQNAVPPRASDQYVVLTDLDLLVPEACDWPKRAVTAIQQQGGGVVAFDLQLKNYVSPNRGHVEDGHEFGIWLMSFDKATLRAAGGVPYVDSKIIQRVRKKGFPTQRIRDATCKLYHMGWDIWKDHPDLWEMKNKGFKWNKVFEYKKPIVLRSLQDFERSDVKKYFKTT